MKHIKFLNSKSKILNSLSYTLIEILMVIVIMALLMVAAMPAFTEMMKGQGVEAGARGLGQTLKLARSHAINNREYVAVLIPKIPASPADLPASYPFRSYRVCLVTNSSGVYTFKRWLSGENWEFLSTGVAVVDIDDTANYDNGTFASAKTIEEVNCSDITGAADVDLTGIVFKPNGQSSNSSFVIIGEAIESGGDLIRTNTSGDLNLTINQYTGRVTFGED